MFIGWLDIDNLINFVCLCFNFFFFNFLFKFYKNEMFYQEQQYPHRCIKTNLILQRSSNIHKNVYVVVACWTLSNNQLILFMDNCFATLMHSCKYFSMERLLTCKRIQVYKFSYTKLTFSHQSFAKQNTIRYDKLN